VYENSNPGILSCATAQSCWHINISEKCNASIFRIEENVYRWRGSLHYMGMMKEGSHFDPVERPDPDQ
jgi:hypothetical protein